MSQIGCGIYIGMNAGRGFKIGRSNNINKREQQIRNMNPSFRILVAISVSPKDSVRLEKHFHEKYENKRIVSEWFDLDVSDIAEMTQTDQTTVNFMIEFGRKRIKKEENNES